MDLDKISPHKLKTLSEEVLRKDLVIPLLKEIEAQNVTDMHGPSEKGIDVYFETYDIFGHKRRFGMQVKTIDIVQEGQAGKGNIITIMNQIEMAFSNSIVFGTSEKGREEVYIDGFYILTSGKVSPNAARYIREKRNKYPYVYIIDGDETLRIIRNRKFLKRRILEIPIGSPLSVSGNKIA